MACGGCGCRPQCDNQSSNSCNRDRFDEGLRAGYAAGFRAGFVSCLEEDEQDNSCGCGCGCGCNRM